MVLRNIDFIRSLLTVNLISLHVTSDYIRLPNASSQNTFVLITLWIVMSPKNFLCIVKFLFRLSLLQWAN